jgi:hypothetical protein
MLASSSLASRQEFQPATMDPKVHEGDRRLRS